MKIKTDVITTRDFFQSFDNFAIGPYVAILYRSPRCAVARPYCHIRL